MRYLKVTAQDRSGNGMADTVWLHFYRKKSYTPDELIHEAVAIDINADEQIDFEFSGDVNNDGKYNVADKQWLRMFANTFLALNWFNQHDNWHRYLTVAVESYSREGAPQAVKLNFYEDGCAGGRLTLVYSAAAYDSDDDSMLESFTNNDIDRNGVIDKADKKLIKLMSSSFLAFKWY